MMFSKPPAVVEMERVLRSRTIPAKEPESSSEQEKKKVKPAKKPKSIPNSEEPSKKSLPKEPKPKATKRKSAKGPAKNSTKNGNVVSISFVHFQLCLCTKKSIEFTLVWQFAIKWCNE